MKYEIIFLTELHQTLFVFLRLEKSALLQLPSKQKAEKQKISIPLLYFAQQKKLLNP